MLIENQSRLNQRAGIAFQDGSQGKASQNICEQNEESGVLVSGAETTPELSENQCRQESSRGNQCLEMAPRVFAREMCVNRILSTEY